MTIFEQQIDPSQIYMSWRLLPLFIIVSGGIIIGTAVLGLVLNFVIYQWDKTKAPAIVKSITTLILSIAIVGTCIVTVLTAATNPLPIDALTTPQLNKKTAGFKITDKSFIADVYRDEIDAAVEDKLSDYNVPDYATDNPQESILYGGDSLKSVATIKDGKTYTLKPDRNYNSATHTIKLTVTIKEGYHPGEI